MDPNKETNKCMNKSSVCPLLIMVPKLIKVNVTVHINLFPSPKSWNDGKIKMLMDKGSTINHLGEGVVRIGKKCAYGNVKQHTNKHGLSSIAYFLCMDTFKGVSINYGRGRVSDSVPPPQARCGGQKLHLASKQKEPGCRCENHL